MMRYLLGICGVSLFALCMVAGCGAKKQEPANTPQETTQTAEDQTKAEEAKAEENKAEEAKAEENKAEENKAEENKTEEAKAEENKAEEAKKVEIAAPKRLHVSELKSFVERVHVEDVDGIKEPDLNDDGGGIDPEYPAIFNHNNGEDEDHTRWVETKGIFAGLAKDFQDSLTSPELLGPASVTKNITIEDMKKTDDGTSFILRIGKGDGFEDAYDLGVTIDTIYNKDEKVVGWRYHGQKIAGSAAVEKAEQDLMIYQLNARNCYIEYRNVLKGTCFNDDGMVNDRSNLENYWNNVSHIFVDSILDGE